MILIEILAYLYLWNLKYNSSITHNKKKIIVWEVIVLVLNILII